MREVAASIRSFFSFQHFNIAHGKVSFQCIIIIMHNIKMPIGDNIILKAT